MAISAAFTVNGNANPAAHAVAYGATVTMVLQSISGANSIVWEVMGSSHMDVVNPTISLSGTPNGSTATFNMVSDPGGTEGRSVLIRCTVTGSDGTQARQSAIIGVLNGNSLLPIGAGEEYERSSTHGWAPEVNKALAGTGGGGGGGYTTVQEEGSSLTQRSTINFVGAGVTATDAGGKTVVTIPGGTTVNLPANPADDGKVAIASGGNLSYSLLANANITNATITLAKMAAIAALSIVANATNASAVPTAVAGTTDQVLRVDGAGTTLGFGSIDLSKAATVGSSKLALANHPDLAGLSVLGRSANSSGVMAAITGTDGQALRVSGTTLGFGTLVTAAYADNSVTLAKLATQAALTVLANGTNATAVPTAIAAGTDGNILRRSGTTLGFGSIDLAAAGAVGSSLLAFANIANGSARSVLARAANSSGVHASLAGGGANTVLVDNGTTLSFTTLGLSSLSAVTALSVLGNGTNASAAPTALAAATDGDVMRRSGTTVGFGAPNFAAQNITTTGVISLGTNPAAAGAIRIASATTFASRNNANSADLVHTRTNSSDGMFIGEGAASYSIGDNKINIGTHIEISTVQFRFDSAVVAPNILQELDATATVTGDLFTINAQDCSGTTAVTAGAMAIRAGNATGASGTRNGGAITIASGTGATADGNLTLYRGATAVFSATSTATAMGNSTTIIEGASLSGRTVVALCRGAAVSATQVPSGSGVVFINTVTTAPSSNPVNGNVRWVDASGNEWVRGSSGTITMIAAA